MSLPGRWPGTWRVICDVCGFKFNSDQVKKRWDGLIVCEKDFEHRHEQDLIRSFPDNPIPPFVRPEVSDHYVHFCTPFTVQGLADLGTADCAIADYDTLDCDFCTVTGKQSVAGHAVASCMVAGWHKGTMLAEPSLCYDRDNWNPYINYLTTEDGDWILTEEGEPIRI